MMRLLSICPRIRKQSDCIVVTTAWRFRIFFLGAIYRRVVVSPADKTVSIISRYLWLFRRQRKVRFDHISAVTYGYEDLSPVSWLAYAHDSWDWFTVGLRFQDESELLLFNFIGDGTFTNDGPLPDWLYWEDYAFDMTGEQENESRVFADVLSKMTGTKIVPPRYI